MIFLASLSAIAKKRPAFYGRILPVLLGFDPSSAVINGVHVSGAHHALKNAFLTCLKCTHKGAAPVFCLIPDYSKYLIFVLLKMFMLYLWYQFLMSEGVKVDEITALKCLIICGSERH